MIQLNPRESFIITHQLNNSYITDTSYVRAVIRNAKTDVTLATKDLTDQGNGRFTTTYQVPTDVSGQGFYISIVTSVYSDSGYTTKSQNYGDEVNTYLVQERFNTTLGGLGGGGGSDIDYKKIRKIIEEEINKIEKPEVIDLSNLESIINSISENVKMIKIREFPKVDLVPVVESIRDIEISIVKKVDSMKIPEFDYSIITTHMDKVQEDLLDKINKLSDLSDSQKNEISVIMKESLDKNSSRFDKMKEMKKRFDEIFPEISNDNNDTLPPVGKDDPRIMRLMNMNK